MSQLFTGKTIITDVGNFVVVPIKNIQRIVLDISMVLHSVRPSYSACVTKEQVYHPHWNRSEIQRVILNLFSVAYNLLQRFGLSFTSFLSLLVRSAGNNTYMLTEVAVDNYLNKSINCSRLLQSYIFRQLCIELNRFTVYTQTSIDVNCWKIP